MSPLTMTTIFPSTGNSRLQPCTAPFKNLKNTSVCLQNSLARDAEENVSSSNCKQVAHFQPQASAQTAPVVSRLSFGPRGYLKGAPLSSHDVEAYTYNSSHILSQFARHYPNAALKLCQSSDLSEQNFLHLCSHQIKSLES